MSGGSKRRPPQVVVTCARGSSAHAATFGKHLIERYIGIPVAEAAPNIASVYGRRLRLENQLFLAISQSGRSDDLVALASSAKAAGALTVAIVNATDGPLVAGMRHRAADRRRSGAQRRSEQDVRRDARRPAAPDARPGRTTQASAAPSTRLPDRLTAAAELDWSELVDTLVGTKSLVAIGRGPTLAIAREASLKLKETCRLHAEAFSGAEFLHGPVALVVTALSRPDVHADRRCGAHGMRAARNQPHRKRHRAAHHRARCFRRGRLPTVASDHPETDAVCLIQSFYAMLIRLAERLGTDVDRPRHLRKVTRTR